MSIIIIIINEQGWKSDTSGTNMCMCSSGLVIVSSSIVHLQQCHRVSLKAMCLKNTLTHTNIQISKYSAFAYAAVPYSQLKKLCT